MAGLATTVFLTVLLFLNVYLFLSIYLADRQFLSYHRDLLNRHFPSERMIDVYQKQALQRKIVLRRLISQRTGSHADFYNTLVPEVFCYELLRIGSSTHGGKWICNPYNIPDNCTILSVGLKNEVSFDMDIQLLTSSRCEIVAVDKYNQSDETKNKLAAMNGRLVRAKLGTKKGDNTLERLVVDEEIENLEIAKIDVERGDFDNIIPFLDSHMPAQILVQIHNRNGSPGKIKLLHDISKRGYWLVAHEISGTQLNLCDFTFIHESAFEKYQVEPLAQYLDL
ncbi:unnamed protein product [Auanema sp. JU1783]|nr:unnamed protein product [Auanema sp. JU1783]